MTRVKLLVLVLAVAIAAAAVASAALSPKAELAAMKRAANIKHSAHDVLVNTSPGYKVRTVSDVGLVKGVRRMTVTHLTKTGTGEVRVILKSAYIKGNAFMMRFWGFLPGTAKKFAGRWIFIPHSSPAYASFADGATFPSFTADLFPPSGLSLVKAGRLIGVHGTAVTQEGQTVAETVFAPAHGKPLPVKQIATFPGHPGKDLTIISRWNEAVHVTVPARAIPIEALTGS